MSVDRGPMLLAIACILAGMAGLGIVFAWEESKRLREQRLHIRKGFLGSEGARRAELITVSTGFAKHMLVLLANMSLVVAAKPTHKMFTQGALAVGSKRYGKVMSKTGLTGEISEAGFFKLRAYLCLALMGVCSLVGAVFSNELMLVLGSCGAAFGWRAPLWALRQECSARREDLENHLSEMLEVITLGLRSGLSFDRAFELYHCHFSNHLAKGSASAQRRWQLGLDKREDALRGLAASYDSLLFSRVIENIIRSLRFGASLADSLDASASEARAIHKAQREEAVAKAPVKMLVPTAALILPAMLLLVLGPVLLDMMQGL